ncbi:lysosomal acid glucosylceramidase isoform X2 [Hyalella azteca]|uniref:Glucosylceramidase n=1 Tax=Hyalella azteca TaxID=294128 RepID=A0A8B7NL64_HYAAZ|nr:lysosomal acid glucosylceramidase isoform X2 [Hyalella azteca]
MNMGTIGIVFFILGLLDMSWCQSVQQPCVPHMPNYNITSSEELSFTCLCNATYCDTFPTPVAPEYPLFLDVTSDRQQHRFFQTVAEFQAAGSPDDSDDAWFDLTDIEAQAILGFGGAVTDSAAFNVLSLRPATQDQLLRAYYSSSGLEYNLNRINIGGCDFSSRGYTYVDTEGDVALETFALQPEDLEQKIPVIHRINAMSDEEVLTFAAAWSAPGWMKTNGDLVGYGQLLETMYQPWAEYHVKFLDAYAAQNVSIWGISTQNEPTDGNIPGFSFNCMGWTPETQRKFLVENFGPALEQHGYDSLKVMVFDDQRPYLPEWVSHILEDPEAFAYADGIAVHWYIDYVSDNILNLTHHLYPDKFILATEACEGSNPGQEAVILGSWHRLETYAADIIEDLENWVIGWVDWNIALDLEGGPNWSYNFVDSPIIVDAAADEFYKNPMYYAMGHFSKFIRRGAVHLQLNSVRDGGLRTTAFRNPDGSVAIVILNRQDVAANVTITAEPRGALRVTAGAKSLKTLLFK